MLRFATLQWKGCPLGWPKERSLVWLENQAVGKRLWLAVFSVSTNPTLEPSISWIRISPGHEVVL